uniref:Uncharacterized protein n=1 Tax=Manihot esculenta TaxID=3983 RepID=A0A2C9VNL4_MANES
MQLCWLSLAQLGKLENVVRGLWHLRERTNGKVSTSFPGKLSFWQ